MTDTMKPDPKTPKQSSRPEAIRVRRLQFVDALDIPGSGMGMPTSIKASDQVNASRHEIEYHPWVRSFRVAWFESTKTEPTRVLMICESAVRVWEPA